jgi:hypothetical protein
VVFPSDARNAMRAVLYTSVPKCGTHLLLRYFDRAGFVHAGPYGATTWDECFVDVVRQLREGEYTAWHYHWTAELSSLVAAKGIRAVFLYRDPRAQLVSNLHWIMKTPMHPWHPYLAKHLRTIDERLIALIRGVSQDDVDCFFPPGMRFPDSRSNEGPRSRLQGGITSLFGIYLPWLKDPQCLSVKFEDLIGPRGGETEPGRSRRLSAFKHIRASAQRFSTPRRSRTLYSIRTRRHFGPDMSTRGGRISALPSMPFLQRSRRSCRAH